jgi:hypothetical protein
MEKLATSAATAVIVPTSVVAASAAAVEFRGHVHNWITYETEAKKLHIRISAIRASRNEEEAQIVGILRTRGMERAALQTRTGTINMAPHIITPNMSFSLLEELLPGYFASIGQRNQTADVLAYIRNHRKSEKEYTLDYKAAPADAASLKP